MQMVLAKFFQIAGSLYLFYILTYISNIICLKLEPNEVEKQGLLKGIRIRTHYMTIECSDEDQKKLKDALGSVIRRISTILKVIPIQGPLVLKRKGGCFKQWTYGKNKERCRFYDRKYPAIGELCNEEIRIPSAHLSELSVWGETEDSPVDVRYPQGEGLADADFVVYVRAVSSTSCLQGSSILAHASYCYQDNRGRPVAGYINVCPQKVPSLAPDRIEMILLHEMLHALGFTKRLFEDFRQCSLKADLFGLCNNSRIKSNPVQTVNGVSRLLTPAVKREAIRHFKCQEDKFGPALQEERGVLSHWDSYQMFGSIMTPSPGPPHLSFLDRMTLAVFEDSGWYDVDYSQADVYHWGEGEGCKPSTTEHACILGEYGCHFLHKDKAVCKFITKGGYSVFIPEPGMECSKQDNSSDSSSLEMYSSQSLCFMSNLTTQNTSLGMTGQCYHHQCEDGVLHVKLRNTDWIECPYGKFIQVENLTGVILCPSRKDITCPDDVDGLSSFTASNVSTVPSVRRTTSVTLFHSSASSCSNGYISLIVIYIQFVLSVI